MALALVSLLSGPANARVYMNQEAALRLAFADKTQVERKTLFLKPPQIQAIQKKAKSKINSELVTYYVGQEKGRVLGYAFFESHIVRTMPETFMVVLDAQGRVRFVEMLAFFEPEDYLPPPKWLELFENKALDKDLWVKRGIRNISGSTLTTQAITAGVRRILAIYEIAIKDD